MVKLTPLGGGAPQQVTCGACAPCLVPGLTASAGTPYFPVSRPRPTPERHRLPGMPLGRLERPALSVLASALSSVTAGVTWAAAGEQPASVAVYAAPISAGLAINTTGTVVTCLPLAACLCPASSRA